MFVRVRNQPGKKGPIEYAYLVSNEWNPFKKKHEQKILTALGRVNELPANGIIEKIITALDEFATKIGISSLSEGIILPSLENEELLSGSREWGVWQLVAHLLQQLSLGKILEKVWKQSCSQNSINSQAPSGKAKISFPKFQAVVTGLIGYRLHKRTDASERSTARWYQEQVYLPHKVEINKDDWYRSLDILIEHKDEIERGYYERNQDLFTQGLDLVLFDTTSIYYWGWEGSAREEDLLQYGFSKDGKGNLKQVIMGVLMTSAGEPVAHEVFKGNLADVKSFAKIMEVIKEKYQLKKIILIADRGMVSEQNLISLEQNKFEYIVGIKMRQLPQGLKAKLFTPIDPQRPYQDMEIVKRSMRDGTVKLYSQEYPVEKFSEAEIKKYFTDKVIKKQLKSTTFKEDKLIEQVKKRRLFVCVNPVVAAATKKKRAFFKKIIQYKISHTSTKEWIIKNGYKKYLKFEKGLKPKLDTDRLEAEEMFDGKWVIMTNNQTVNNYQAGNYYQTLQTIERGFRDLKSLITVQPIFHWKEERIRAHIFVCFLALIIKWYICKTLDNNSQKTGRRFIEEMINLKAIEVTAKPPVYVRTAINPQTQEQMRKLKMKIPGKVILDTRVRPIKLNRLGGRPKNRPAKNQLAFFKNN